MQILKTILAIMLNALSSWLCTHSFGPDQSVKESFKLLTKLQSANKGSNKVY